MRALALLAVVALACPGTAWADDEADVSTPPAPSHAGPVAETRLSVRTNYWPSADASFGAFTLEGHMVATNHVAIDVGIPWAIGSVSGDPTMYAALGNIRLGATFFFSTGSHLVMWTGLLFDIPTTYNG